MGKTFRKHRDWDDDYEMADYRDKVRQKELARSRRDMKLMDELKENYEPKSHRT